MKEKKSFKQKINEVFFNLSEQIFLVLDNKGIIIDINKKGCEILGYSKKSIIGKNWFDNFLPRKFKNEIKNVFNKILKGKLKEVEYYENPIIDSKGNYKLVLWHNIYIKDSKGKILNILSAGYDITQKRKIENDLQNQTYLFKMLFDYAPDGYFILDFKGNFKDGNKAAEEMIGYKKEELIGKNIFKLNLTPKKYLPIALKSIMENLKGRQSGPYEFELIRKDGSRIIAEIIARPVQILEENAILCMARNITEKKEIQKQLEKDSFILKSLMDPIFICDIKGDIIFKNEIFEGLISNDKKKCSDVVRPKNKLTFQKIFKTLKEKRKIVYEAEILTKDGELKPFEIYANLIKIGNSYEILSIARDLTNRIRTEEEIRNMIQELNQILDSASSALFITNNEGIILKANKSFFDLFGLKEQDVLGKKCTEIFSLQFHDCFFKQIMSGNSISEFEAEIQIFNGKKINVLINAKPFKNIKGEIVGVIADFKDISKIKDAEKILQESYEKLRQIDALKTTFFSMVSHELKNPLTSIKGFTSLLYKGAAGNLTEQQKEFIETISNNTERLLNLINELLDMSRIESGTFSIQRKKTNVIESVNKAIKEMAPIAAQKNIRLSLLNDINEYYLEIDEYRIIQVVINIINNAIKFMKEGKNIFIKISTKSKNDIKLPDYVNVNLEDKQYLIISIKDEGPGIDKENLIKIFEKFYQIKQSDKSKGLGLGLFIAKAIIDAHNGFIYAESEGKDRGATFYILL